MLIVISPAKSLDFVSPTKSKKFTQPDFLEHSNSLIKRLRELSPDDLSELMNISANLGELNYQRYSNWNTPFTLDNARQAIFAFKGDVYLGLRVEDYGTRDLTFAQKHLRILSGLYGALRPLDLIQPYRLEMGVKFKNDRGKNLYEFWENRPTDALNQSLDQLKNKTLINLASNEYFRSVNTKRLDARIVTPVFRDYKNGNYKIISFFAKKARGLMASYIIKNRLTRVGDLKSFSLEGYRYSKADSCSDQLVFLRKAA